MAANEGKSSFTHHLSKSYHTFIAPKSANSCQYPLGPTRRISNRQSSNWTIAVSTLAPGYYPKQKSFSNIPTVLRYTIQENGHQRDTAANGVLIDR